MSIKDKFTALAITVIGLGTAVALNNLEKQSQNEAAASNKINDESVVRSFLEIYPAGKITSDVSHGPVCSNHIVTGHFTGNSPAKQPGMIITSLLFKAGQSNVLSSDHRVGSIDTVRVMVNNDKDVPVVFNAKIQDGKVTPNVNVTFETTTKLSPNEFNRAMAALNTGLNACVPKWKIAETRFFETLPRNQY